MELTISANTPSRTDLLPPPDSGETTDTSDAGRINSAIRQIYNAGGGTLNLEAGIYEVSSSIRLRNGVLIKGASELYSGTGGTVIRATADIEVFDTFEDDSDYPDINPVSNVRIENLLVIPADEIVSTKPAFNLVGFRYGVEVKNVIVRNFYNGFYVSHAWKLKMDEAKAVYCTNAGIVIKNAGNRISLYDCEFNNNYIGVKMEIGTLRNQNILLLGCVMEHNSYGVWVDDTDCVTIQNCYFEVNYLAAVLLRGELGHENRLALIMGNRFFGNSSGTSGNYGIETRVYTEKYEVFCNTFRGLEVAGMKVTKGIIEGQIRTNAWIDGTPIEYVGTGYTPLVANNGSIDHKGYNPIKNVTINPV